MILSKCRYLHTHIIEKGENIKISSWNSMYSDSDKEEQMVARVGGEEGA